MPHRLALAAPRPRARSLRRLGPGPHPLHLRDQLVSAGRARRLLSGEGGRHLRGLRSRRDDRARRAAGERPGAPHRRQDRRLHGRQPPPVLLGRARGHPLARRRGALPEGAAGRDEPPGSGSRCLGGPAGRRRLHHRRQRVPELLSVDGVGIRLRSGEAPALHVQPGRLHRQPEVGAAGLPDVRALRDIEGRRVRAQRLPPRRLRVRHLCDDGRDDGALRRGEPRGRPVLRRRLGDWLDQLPLWRQCRRQRPSSRRPTRR